jgi:hypothetical protein
MRPYMSRTLGQDVLDVRTLSLVTITWAPNTSGTYGSTIQRYFEFCDEQELIPLAGDPAATARFVT